MSRIFSCFPTFLLANGVPEPPERFLSKVTYQVETSVSYALPEGVRTEDFEPSELIRFKSTRTFDRVEKYLVPEEGVVSITFHDRSRGIFPDWMDRPVVTYIDQEGVTKYNRNGTAIFEQNHDDYFRGLLKVTSALTDPGSFGYHRLPQYSERQLDHLRENGFRVDHLGERVVSIANDRTELIFDADRGYSKLSKFKEAEISRTEEKITKLIYDDYAIPLQEIIREFKTSKFGVCYEKTTIITYQDYKVESEVGTRDQANSSESPPHDQLKVVPNPATHEMNVHLPPNTFTDGENIRISIIGSTGEQVIPVRTRKVTDAILRLDVAFLPPGAYLLRIAGRNHQFSTKFAKL